jgi:hypothetical protein
MVGQQVECKENVSESARIFLMGEEETTAELPMTIREWVATRGFDDVSVAGV